MIDYKSLKHFKEVNGIDDNYGLRISKIIEQLYHDYLYQNFNGDNDALYEELLKECNKINPTLIPYSELTNIIFVNKPVGYYLQDNDSSFPERLKAGMEQYINFAHGIALEKESPQTNEDIFSAGNSSSQELSIDERDQVGILVFYKIIQHIELAIAQKESLFENQIRTINELEQNIYETSQKYNNMVSNFISILGIFAAIMMATFGSIQGFTSLFTNENNYSLTEIFLISSLGLFALLSIIFLLFYSISKLTDRNISNNPYIQQKFTNQYPIYSHTIIISGVIFLLSLTHHIKINQPSYLPELLVNNLWLITIILMLILYGIYTIYNLFSKYNGHIYVNEYTYKLIIYLKNKIGLKFLVALTIIAPFIILLILVFVLFLLNI